MRQFVFSDKPVDEFVDYLLAKENYGRVIVISHFGSGFDNQFIFKRLVDLKKYRIKPSVILRGTKIIVMTFGNLKFVDSYNYFHMTLSSLPKAYRFPNKEKVFFPHFFNTKENSSYVGPLPPRDTYGPDHMKSEERAQFLKWYENNEKNNYVFDFQKELRRYCNNDVLILRKACLAFRETFLKCCNVDPFLEAKTIASTCLLVFRKKYLKPKMIGILPKNGYKMADNQSTKALLWLSWIKKF